MITNLPENSPPDYDKYRILRDKINAIIDQLNEFSEKEPMMQKPSESEERNV